MSIFIIKFSCMATLFMYSALIISTIQSAANYNESKN